MLNSTNQKLTITGVGSFPAVRNNTALGQIFFTDQHKLREHAPVLKERESSNAQFNEHKESFATFNSGMSASNTLLQQARPTALSIEPLPNTHGGRSATSIAAAAAAAAAAAIPPLQPAQLGVAAPARSARVRRCLKCGHPTKGHPKSTCPRQALPLPVPLQAAPVLPPAQLATRVRRIFHFAPSGCLLGPACAFSHEPPV